MKKFLVSTIAALLLLSLILAACGSSGTMRRSRSPPWKVFPQPFPTFPSVPNGGG